MCGDAEPRVYWRAPSAVRFLASGVSSSFRSARRAAVNGGPVMAPSGATVTPRASNHVFPSLFVLAPPCAAWMYTGRPTASSSASVGRRRSANCIAATGPMVVMNSPGGTSALRAFKAATASGTVKTCSSGVCQPGRFPTSTMWLCASMIPGITVRPFRSTRLGFPPRASTLLPTAAKRPLRISACETTRLFWSIVWIRPLTSTRAPSAGVPAAAGRCACADSSVRLRAPPMPSAPARPRNLRRENPCAVSF